MNDFFNSLNNSFYDKLCDIDLSIHTSGVLKNSWIDDFIHDLRDYLVKSDVKYRISKLPSNTIFEVNEIEEDFIQCYLNHEEFPIPHEMICMYELHSEDVGHVRITTSK